MLRLVTKSIRFSQASDTLHACRHPHLVIRPGDGGAVSCHCCGKRWVPEVG